MEPAIAARTFFDWVEEIHEGNRLPVGVGRNRDADHIPMAGDQGRLVAPGIQSQQAVVATVQMQPEKLQRLRCRLSRRQAINLAAAAARATFDRREQRKQPIDGDGLRHPLCPLPPNIPPSGLNCTVIGAWSIVCLIPLLQYLISKTHCPVCGATDVGRSHRANLAEAFLSCIRLWPMRCNDCGTRWMVLSWKDPKDSPD